MIKKLSIIDFLNASEKEGVIIDARSEGEYEKGHIPGAINLPLLNNEERAKVGTVYKKEGREKAVLTGFELTGHKFAEKITKAQEAAPNKKVFIYCWRGGLRSNTIAWVLSLAGFKVSVLEGGYKSYRKHVINSFDNNYNLVVLGGKTGSGKTELIERLKEAGNSVLDLEGFANHKGSAFGALGQNKQPSYEQFENLLHAELNKVSKEERIWVENESRLIGSVKIPDAFYLQMRQAPVIELLVPFEQRVKRIIKEYGEFPKDELIKNTLKLSKRLGNLRTNQAIDFLNNNDLENWIEMVLNYYDKTYEYGMSLREAPKTTQVIYDYNNIEDTVTKLTLALDQTCEA